MPIYCNLNGVNKAPWVIVKEMSIKDIKKYISIFQKAMKKFKYKNDALFLHTIDINIYNVTNNCYIASFDKSKTTIPVFNYQNELEELINYANELMLRSHIDNYKFDIMGTWITGKVIIMTKNKEGKA
jgi:hypothetical protein